MSRIPRRPMQASGAHAGAAPNQSGLAAIGIDASEPALDMSAGQRDGRPPAPPTAAAKAATRALEAARMEAEAANAAKSRFLAAASHDLRQPLQTLALLQALLAEAVTGEKAKSLVARQHATLATMTGLLDTLLDIAGIEAGAAQRDVSVFGIAGLPGRLPDETPIRVPSRIGHGSGCPIETPRLGRAAAAPSPADRPNIASRDAASWVPVAEDVPAPGDALAGSPRAMPDLALADDDLPGGSDGLMPSDTGQPLILVVDDDDGVRGAIMAALESDGRTVAGFSSGEAFLHAFQPGRAACLLIDAALPGINGMDLLEQLRATGHGVPAIVITGQSDVPMAIRAMKAGASDFIEKPVDRRGLLASVARALDRSLDAAKLAAWHAAAAAQVAGLTPRQRQIIALVLAGQPSKNIATDLGISQRTVENHRASIMRRTGATSLPALARLAMAASATVPNGKQSQTRVTP